MYRPSRVVGQWSCPGQRAAAMWKHCSLPEVRLTSEGPYGGAGGGCISISDPVSVTQRPHRNSENDRSRRFGLGFGFGARDRSRNLSFSELYACKKFETFRSEMRLKIRQNPQAASRQCSVDLVRTCRNAAEVGRRPFRRISARSRTISD